MTVVKPPPPHLPQPPLPGKTVQRRVLLKPVRPERRGIRFELVGDDKPTGGTAVWADVDRPRRRQGAEFTGITARRNVLPLLLTGMEKTPGRDVTIEPECRQLQEWAAKPTKKTNLPCILKATGPLRTGESVRWVIESIEWGDQIRNARGRRVQQYVTVTLREYIAANVKRSPAKASRDRKGKGKD